MSKTESTHHVVYKQPLSSATDCEGTNVFLRNKTHNRSPAIGKQVCKGNNVHFKRNEIQQQEKE